MQILKINSTASTNRADFNNSKTQKEPSFKGELYFVCHDFQIPTKKQSFIQCIRMLNLLISRAVGCVTELDRENGTAAIRFFDLHSQRVKDMPAVSELMQASSKEKNGLTIEFKEKSDPLQVDNPANLLDEKNY